MICSCSSGFPWVTASSSNGASFTLNMGLLKNFDSHYVPQKHPRRFLWIMGNITWTKHYIYSWFHDGSIFSWYSCEITQLSAECGSSHGGNAWECSADLGGSSYWASRLQTVVHESGKVPFFWSINHVSISQLSIYHIRICVDRDSQLVSWLIS